MCQRLQDNINDPQKMYILFLFTQDAYDDFQNLYTPCAESNIPAHNEVMETEDNTPSNTDPKNDSSTEEYYSDSDQPLNTDIENELQVQNCEASSSDDDADDTTNPQNTSEPDVPTAHSEE